MHCLPSRPQATSQRARDGGQGAQVRVSGRSASKRKQENMKGQGRCGAQGAAPCDKRYVEVRASLLCTWGTAQGHPTLRKELVHGDEHDGDADEEVERQRMPSLERSVITLQSPNFAPRQGTRRCA